MWKLLSALITIVIVATSVLVWHEARNLSNLFITLVGSFWGFLLAQIGVVLYGNKKEKEELIAMMISVRSELVMNRATVGWIGHLIETGQEQVDVHGLGFAGTDKISIAAAENLVHSPLTYKWASPSFTAKPLLTIYQTLTVIEREMPTTNVGVSHASVYGRVKFSAVDGAFQTLIDLLDDEAKRLCGVKRWSQLVSKIDPHSTIDNSPRQLTDTKTDRIIELLESIHGKLMDRENQV